MQDQYDTALDVSFRYSAGGFGSYTRALLKHMIKHYHATAFLLLENELPASIPQYAHSEHYPEAPLPDHWGHVKTSRASRLWWMQFDLPKLIKKHQPGCFHSVDNISVCRASSKTKTVLTLHDMIPLSHPQYARKRDALAAAWLIPRAVKYADKVITDSYYSARQIINRFPRHAKKVNVVYLGIDHHLYAPHPERETLCARLQQKYQLSSSLYFFNVSTLSPRKNLIRLLRAFHQLITENRQSEVCLVIAGCDGWNVKPIYQLLNELHLIERVHFVGFVPDEDLIAFHQSAYAFVFPSLLEGFGLPVLEAMACGTPVICSNTTSLQEMFEGSAFTVNPLQVSALQSAMNDLLTDSILWAELSQKGTELAGLYDWNKTVKEVVSVYRSALES